jgi:predicted nucleotide-binding protein
MPRPRVLFQGSVPDEATESQTKRAKAIAHELGGALVREGFDLVFTGRSALDRLVGAAAVAACEESRCMPRDRITTYSTNEDPEPGEYFGSVLLPPSNTPRDGRTFAVRECDAVVGLCGRKGTSDSLQKAWLARKAVFPVAVAGGASKEEWEQWRREGYCNRVKGDLDFLGDRNLAPQEMARKIAQECAVVTRPQARAYSPRVFVVHGHDLALKSEVARCLDTLGLTPVILNETAERGRTLMEKLEAEFADVGFGVILLTPDDAGGPAASAALQPRARQNVIFEWGWLIGRLGRDRVWVIMKGEVEKPSDLGGIVDERLPEGGNLGAAKLALVKNLRAAGYDVDANRL